MRVKLNKCLKITRKNSSFFRQKFNIVCHHIIKQIILYWLFYVILTNFLIFPLKLGALAIYRRTFVDMFVHPIFVSIWERPLRVNICCPWAVKIFKGVMAIASTTDGDINNPVANKKTTMCQ